MSQSWFSLRFLSQNSLLELFTIRGYKSIYSRVREECEELVFIQTGHSGDLVSRVEWVASLSCKLTAWPDCTFCPVVLQLSWPFSFLHASHMCHSGDLPVTKPFLSAHIWVFFTLSHTLPLHNSHLNTGYLIAKLQVNLAINLIYQEENVITLINSLDILCMMIQRWTFIFIEYFVGPIWHHCCMHTLDGDWH